MAKLPRVFQKIFGTNAPSNQIGVFGSLAAGSPSTGTNLNTLQSLSNFTDGWYAAVLGGNSPAIQDVNALYYLIFSQLAYMFQSGIPEWDQSTIYYSGSMVSSGGEIYVSLTDTNTNNPLTSAANWKLIRQATRVTTANDTATVADDFIRADATAAAFNQTLPAIASVPIGKIITVKRINTNLFKVIVKGNGSELLDGANTFELISPYDSIAVRSNGTTWDII